MLNLANKKTYKKIALALSLCAILLWSFLGTGTSLAWFTDTSPKINNIFHFSDFDVDVSYRRPNTSWSPMDGQTTIFDEQALYEPGYVQIVYLEVRNNGAHKLTCQTAVTATDFAPVMNALGHEFNLRDHLRFGLVSASSEAAMEALVADREKAKAVATAPLNNYHSKDGIDLPAGGAAYVALIVRMPEEVGNVANHRSDTAPKIELGVIVTAQQTAD